MRCPRCGADNPAGLSFCGRCGELLPLVCPSCGASNLADHKFCGHCGTPLDSRAAPDPAAPRVAAGDNGLPGEIKQVTVLFCDIVNSTALTERLGAEAMHELVSAFIDASLAEVHRFGGTAPQFTGDGFMALFGAPLTQEDHVRRALLAALAIRRAVSGDREMDGQRALDLQIRIGVDTGPVVFGAIGGSFRTETAIGDTANLAARIQQAAEPGTILVSATVRGLAQGYARLEPVGSLIVKGKEEPVSAYRLLSISRWRSVRDAVPPARTTRFVGRDAELALLESLLRQVESGRGQVVSVVGEPGIGKSRLLAEFRRRAGKGRIIWVEGQCLSYGGAIPYSLALDLLRSHCDIIETDSAEAIAQKVRAGLRAAGMDAEQDSPVLLHLLGLKDVSLPALPSPEAIKVKSFEVLKQLCREGSRRRPLVLALEDLHWVDTISEELLGALAKEVSAACILLLATYRPEYRSTWAEGLEIAEILLEPLSRRDSLHVVRSVLRGEEIAPPLAEQIVGRADGNPLFLEQLALHMGEAGNGRADLTVPRTIHGVVMARIDRLPEATKHLLQTAAVIGREFSLRLLRAVWHGRGPLETQLRELSRLEFLDEWPDDEGTTYVFRHALTQEAAYVSLLERDRRARHGAIGHALEQLYDGRTEEVAELLALHFGRSGEAEKAVDSAIKAAVKAGRGWANSDALTWFGDALHRLALMLDTPPNRLRRIDIVLKQAEVKYALGLYTEQIKDLEEIHESATEIGDPLRRATWYYWTGFLHSVSGGRPEVAIANCREAARIASASGVHEIDAFAESCLSQVYMVAGRLHDAVEAGERAVASFEARDNPWWAALTLWHLTATANYLGEWSASLDYCKRALKHGISVNDVRLTAVSWSRMGVAHIVQGDIEVGLECCNQARALASVPRDAAYAKMVSGYGLIRLGRLAEGIEELSEALAWFETSHMRYTQVIGNCWLAEGYIRRMDLAARPLIETLLTTCKAAGYFHYEGRAFWLMSECLHAEAPERAEDYAETALRIFEQVGARNDLARAMVTRAAFRQRAGKVRAARQLLDQAHTIFQNLGTRSEPVRVEAALAALDRGLPIRFLTG